MKESFDTITMVHFFPNLEVLDKVMELLQVEGVLYCITFVNDNFVEANSKYEIGIGKKEIELIRKKYNLLNEGYRVDSRGEFYTFILGKDKVE